MLCFTSTTQHLKTEGALQYISKTFPDGEFFVELKECVKDKSIAIIHSTCPPVNDHVMELLILVDALKQGFASHIHLVMPYFGYSRQDRLTSEGTSISAKVVANLIGNSGIDRLSVLDLHAPQIAGFFPIPVKHLSAIPLFADVINKEFSKDNTFIVSPDLGGLKRAEVLADLIKFPLIALTKKRDLSGTIEHVQVLGDPSGKHCVIVDDIVDSGKTLDAAAEMLHSKGALSVTAFVTHAVLSNPVDFRHIERLFVTDSIWHEALPSNITVLKGAICF